MAAHSGGHPTEQGATHAEAHGGPKLYWIFCVILCLITFFEWAIFKYKEDWGVTDAVMVPALLGMSLVKFVMVVGWYMHLRYDPGWMKKMFLVAFVMGGGVSLALFVLMGGPA